MMEISGVAGRRDRVARALQELMPMSLGTAQLMAQDAIAAYRAALSDAGMVIVPREATREMLDAALDGYRDTSEHFPMMADDWRAMIAAAPRCSPEQDERGARAMVVVEAALRFCMLNGTKKAEAHKDLADAVMWFTPWFAAQE